MSTEQNKAVVRRFIEEILSNQNAALVDELFASDYTNHLVPGGREGFKQFFWCLRTSGGAVSRAIQGDSHQAVALTGGR